jgi:hypothetical protein
MNKALQDEEEADDEEDQEEEGELDQEVADLNADNED